MNKQEKGQEIYQKLRELRKARGLTVNTLSEKIGENSQKVARIERGARSLTVDYLVKVSKALEAPVSSLIEASQSAGNSTSSTELLNSVVLWIEEHYARFTKNPNPKKKAKMISKIYELTSAFSKENQELFLSSLFDAFAFFCELEETT